MAQVWSDWSPDRDVKNPDPQSAEDLRKDRTSYVAWYVEVEKPEDIDPETDFLRLDLVRAPVFRRVAAALAEAKSPVRDQPTPTARLDSRSGISGLSTFVPLPGYAKPAEKFAAPEPDLSRHLRAPPVDAVIVGVIDSAIALAHERFRETDDGRAVRTRFLGAWQQGAAAVAGGRAAFGRDLLQDEIEGLLAAAGGAHGVEEGAFNRAAGLTKWDHPRGDRALDRNAAHGTHVLDLATGSDPADPDDAAHRALHPIIAVTLPPRPSIGAAGSFLEYFVIHAIEYILDLADATWTTFHHGAVPKEGVHGFPVVINLSYGLLAGPKDGAMAVEKYIARIQRRRADARWSPVRVVMPAGNDNLARGVALAQFRDNGPLTIAWRIMPEDRTSNYVEVWTGRLDGQWNGDEPHPFRIGLTTPDGMVADPMAPKPGMVRELRDGDTLLARITCELNDNGMPGLDEKGTAFRFKYLICVAPTWRASGRAARAGVWTITLERRGGLDAALLFVQSDQSLTYPDGTALTSYFDQPTYRRHDARGRLIDTVGFPADGPPQDMDQPAADRATGPIAVERRNSLNAIANDRHIVTVAGYRATDGCPASYSSSGRGHPKGDGQDGPTVAFPSDDGAAHFGRLGAGSRSGSVVAMQGTSFACADATRHLATALQAWHGSDRPADGNLPAREAKDIGRPLWWETQSEAQGGLAFDPPLDDPDGKPEEIRDLLRVKLGARRFPRAARRRIPRRGPPF